MDLKTRFQYTYFIHNFIIKESKYNKYILKLLTDGRFKLRIFKKEKDLEVYTHFLPKIKDMLFKTFELESELSQKKLDDLPIETKAAVLSKYPSVTFEYDLSKDIQGKTVDKDSIFFKIQKVGVILFNTGICFLYLKTNIEDSDEFSEILNFNYKFKDINEETYNLKNYEKIKIQTDAFENMEELQDFISSITGPNLDALKLNIDIEKFYTFSYTCIKQEVWNANTPFEDISNEFLKYINILSNDSNTNSLINKNTKILDISKYAKIGISKAGVNLLSSECDLNNYTTLPIEYENQYFYTYILALYLKVYLKKLNFEFKEEKDLEETRKKFVEFTKGIWIQEITSSDLGSLYYSYIKDALEIDKIFNEVKNKYNILYSELKIEKNEKKTTAVIIVLIITLIVNIINLILYLN